MELKEYVQKLKLYLFDMDGTLYLGDRLYDFTIELLDTIKNTGGTYLFMTNNSSKSVNDYVKKLQKLCITATKDDFMTSSQAIGCPEKKLKKANPSYKFTRSSHNEQTAPHLLNKYGIILVLTNGVFLQRPLLKDNDPAVLKFVADNIRSKGKVLKRTALFRPPSCTHSSSFSQLLVT